MENGLFDITDEDYFADPALNNSYLWRLINKTPAHAQIPMPKTDALTIGTATHMAILQPNIATQKIVCGPDTRRGKAWTEAKKEAEENEQILLTKSDFVTCMEMRDSIYRNPAAAHLLTQKGTKYEQSAFFEINGNKCKCKVDASVNDTIIDLKTSADASPSAFVQSVAKFGYHQQSAFYKYGYGQASNKTIAHFIFVVVEKTPPFASAIYELDAVSEKEGWASANSAIDLHNHCVETMNFNGYSAEKIMLTLPTWAYVHTNRDAIQLINKG